MCTCPYFTEGKGYCKHIASVSVNELFKLDFPFLKNVLNKPYRVMRDVHYAFTSNRDCVN
jgi:hypothetical protein